MVSCNLRTRGPKTTFDHRHHVTIGSWKQVAFEALGPAPEDLAPPRGATADARH